MQRTAKEIRSWTLTHTSTAPLRIPQPLLYAYLNRSSGRRKRDLLTFLKETYWSLAVRKDTYSSLTYLRYRKKRDLLTFLKKAYSSLTCLGDVWEREREREREREAYSSLTCLGDVCRYGHCFLVKTLCLSLSLPRARSLSGIPGWCVPPTSATSNLPHLCLQTDRQQEGEGREEGRNFRERERGRERD